MLTSNIKDVQAHIKENKAVFGITGNVTPTAVKNWLKSPNTTDDEINALAILLQDKHEWSTPTASETTPVVIDIEGVEQKIFSYVNQAGVTINAPVIYLAFEEYKNRACRFSMNGALVLNYQDTLANLALNNGIKKGDMVPFNPDTFEQFTGYAIMNINGTAFEKASVLYDYTDKVKEAIDKDTRNMRLRGATQAQINAKIEAKYIDGCMQDTTVPVMPTFK